ncbi:MAG: hypothetical protein ACE5KA_00865 [Nitrososphaerales archaeon]
MTDIRGDFVERFIMFRDAYGNARNKEEKSYLAKDFLKSCTKDEITLVRDVINDVLQKNNFSLPHKLFD